MKVSINPLTKKKGLVFKKTVQAVQFNVIFSAEEQAKTKALGIRDHVLIANVPFKSGGVIDLDVGMLDFAKTPYEAHFDNEGDAAEFIEILKASLQNLKAAMDAHDGPAEAEEFEL